MDDHYIMLLCIVFAVYVLVDFIPGRGQICISFVRENRVKTRHRHRSQQKKRRQTMRWVAQRAEKHAQVVIYFNQQPLRIWAAFRRHFFWKIYVSKPVTSV